MMRLRLLLALATLLGASCADREHPVPDYSGVPDEPERTSGEEEAPPDPQDELRRMRAHAVAQPFLWRVEGEQPSYLFGTIHVGVTLDSALPAEQFAAVDQSRLVMFEVNPDDVNGQDVSRAGAMPRNQTSNSLYPGVVWHDLVQELDRYVTGAQLRQVRPWVAMIMLLQKRVADMHGPNPPAAMDVTLYRYAVEQGLETGTLETPADQFAALGRVPDAEIVASVAEMIQEPARSQQELRALLEGYLSGDEATMEGLIFDPEALNETPGLFEQLFDRRNTAWMRRLRRELDEGGVFVAAGLGHFIGPEGLVARLREAGYAIERVQ